MNVIGCVWVFAARARTINLPLLIAIFQLKLRQDSPTGTPTTTTENDCLT